MTDEQVNVYLTYLHCAGLRWVLLMLQHEANSRNRPTATDEKKNGLLCILVVISLVATISGKSLKWLSLDVIF